MKLFHLLAREIRVRANKNIYRMLYECHAALNSAETAIGDGDFAAMGKIELALLKQEGLEPHHTLIDFGCGSGRLAVHAIPFLTSGRYVGIDIASQLIRAAKKRVEALGPAITCDVSWQLQTTPHFDLPRGSADLICAFSVFTHLEHEDDFRYLASALPVMRPGSKFVLSCLPLDLEEARDEFLRQSELDFAYRWAGVRNVTTSVDMMSEIARMAGWQVVRWYPGNETNITHELASPAALGQSTCVLRAPG